MLTSRLVAIPAAVLLVGVAAFVGALYFDGEESAETPEPTAFVQATATPTDRPTAEPTPTATPYPYPLSLAPIEKLVIPAISVDRPTVEMGIDPETNQMLEPEGPFDIAYYTYSARPGFGNAVFSGHVDHRDVGRAVFWDLDKLNEGDEIVVRLQDGLEMKYLVSFNNTYPDKGGPWEELFAADAAFDVLTVYTCDGDFDPSTRNYNERRVIRAVRAG